MGYEKVRKLFELLTNSVEAIDKSVPAPADFGLLANVVLVLGTFYIYQDKLSKDCIAT